MLDLGAKILIQYIHLCNVLIQVSSVPEMGGTSDHFLLKSMTHVTVTPTSGHTFLLREVHHIHLCNVVIEVSCVPEMRQEMWKVWPFSCSL